MFEIGDEVIIDDGSHLTGISGTIVGMRYITNLYIEQYEVEDEEHNYGMFFANDLLLKI